MKILSISDIHGDLGTLQKMCEKIANVNNFDLILIAGEIGSSSNYKMQKAIDILYFLSELSPKIFFVKGSCGDNFNDSELPKSVINIHLKHVYCNEWCFLGYSEFEGNKTFGSTLVKNHSENINFVRDKYPNFRAYKSSMIFDEIEDYLEKNNIDNDDLIFVTSRRLYKVPFMPYAYIFGRDHKPFYKFHNGIHCLNTSFVTNDIKQPTIYPTPGNYFEISLDNDFKYELKAI